VTRAGQGRHGALRAPPQSGRFDHARLRVVPAECSLTRVWRNRGHNRAVYVDAMANRRASFRRALRRPMRAFASSMTGSGG
jgi:hypothetical protein